MKAISAPRTGVDATDRAERGLGPFATLGCPIFLRHSYLPKGAKGGRGCGGQLAPTAQDGPIVFVRFPRALGHVSRHALAGIPLSEADRPSAAVRRQGRRWPMALAT